MIKTQELKKIYTTEDIETTALAGISLEIEAGGLLAITGPSGCGKSTLLNLLGLIDKSNGGAYFFNGVRVDGYAEKERAGLRKRNMGFIFQNFNLVNELTVYENVELPLLYAGVGKSERKERVNAILEQMSMAHRSKHYPQQLSGGQQQRVAISRAISNNPKILFADEPTGNLDSKHGDEVMNLLLALNKGGTTVIMVTHAAHYANTCNRIIGMLDGKIISDRVKEESHV